MRRALILTNHLHAWAGSEVVALEVAEELQRREYSVTICANVIAADIIELAKNLNIQTSENPGNIDLFDFDFIWSQHSIAPLCKGFENLQNHQGIFISAHLSPNTSFELIGLAFASGKANAILSNSEETRVRIHQIIGAEVPIINFNNAAPPAFINHRRQENYKKKPDHILIASNHITKEIEDAVTILSKSGVTIKIFGICQENYRRITPSDIESSDAVVSIGKTVQYSIMGQRPCFCYDHFGGPGWITRDNIKRALAFNFSGRCSNNRRSGDLIASEILNGYAKAQQEATILSVAYDNIFDLSKTISTLENKTKKLYFQAQHDFLSIHSAALLRQYYRSTAILSREIEKSR